MIICPICEVQIRLYIHSSEISVVLSDSETEDELLLPEFITKRTLWEYESTEYVPIKNRK